jgi:hypothetical protein
MTRSRVAALSIASLHHLASFQFRRRVMRQSTHRSDSFDEQERIHIFYAHQQLNEKQEKKKRVQFWQSEQ